MSSEKGEKGLRLASQNSDWTNNASRTCASCGTEPRRESARFCATCGRRLEGGYFPADSLRASYHSRFQAQAVEGGTERPRVVRQAHQARRARSFSALNGRLPLENRNGASTTALAFVTYALVPYVGIIFCPGALLMGSIGLVRALRAPESGGRRASWAGILLGLLLLALQLFLWWLLYKVPQWAQQP